METNAFMCTTPSNGFWIRLTGIFSTENVDVRKGYSKRFRGLDARAARLLGFGQVFYSSDAEVITCWSRRTGLTCKQFQGLSFWLGRHRDYRIYHDVPGIAPRVRPLFRTAHGIRCGIDRDNLEPSSPLLQCWRSADGLLLSLLHDDEGRRGGHVRSEKAIGFRPPGFRLLEYGNTFAWRCRRVNPHLAEGCSATRGLPVFTCTSSRARLTCRNRSEHGFWASRRSFYTF
jgi:hypothetical protein